MPPCANCRQASGTGRHRTRPGSRVSRGSQEVSSYAIDDGQRLLLFDPLGVPREIEELAAGRENGHRADVPVARARHAEPGRAARRAGVRSPARNSRGLMERFGITAEQAAGGGPDLRLAAGCGLARKDLGPLPAIGYPSGSRRSSERIRRDLVQWIESQRAVIAGDSLGDFGQGLEINVRWLNEGRDARGGRRRRCARCSSFRSSSCSRPTEPPPTEPPSSGRSDLRSILITTGRGLPGAGAQWSSASACVQGLSSDIATRYSGPSLGASSHHGSSQTCMCGNCAIVDQMYTRSTSVTSLIAAMTLPVVAGEGRGLFGVHLGEVEKMATGLEDSRACGCPASGTWRARQVPSSWIQPPGGLSSPRRAGRTSRAQPKGR